MKVLLAIILPVLVVAGVVIAARKIFKAEAGYDDDSPYSTPDGKPDWQ